MLSRVAEHIYWLGRYVERVENTARLINVNTHLLLDLPRPTTFGWEPLLSITGSDALFRQYCGDATEADVVRFLVGDLRNPGGLLSSLVAARENLRTTRDVVPREAWEQINDLYLYARDHLERGIARQGRYDFLRRIIEECQQISGLLAGTMSRTHAFDYLRLGRHLERADMTSRILDVRSANLLPRQVEDLKPFENIQWMNVLKSLSAYQMYRQAMRARVRGPDVVRFLMQDPYFPRTVYRCLLTLEDCLKRLPHSGTLLAGVARVMESVTAARVPELAPDALHKFIDELQIALGHLHGQIAATYFACK